MSTAIIFVCPSSDPYYVGLLTNLLREDYPNKKIFPLNKDPFNADFYIIDETIQKETWNAAIRKHKHVYEICIIMPFFNDIPIHSRMRNQIHHGKFFTPQDYDYPAEELEIIIENILD